MVARQFLRHHRQARIKGSGRSFVHLWACLPSVKQNVSLLSRRRGMISRICRPLRGLGFGFRGYKYGAPDGAGIQMAFRVFGEWFAVKLHPPVFGKCRNHSRPLTTAFIIHHSSSPLPVERAEAVGGGRRVPVTRGARMLPKPSMVSLARDLGRIFIWRWEGFCF